MAISETEALMLLLGYDQICTNIKFVHVSTIPMEERLAYDCSKSVESFQRNQWRADQPSDLNSHDIIPIVVVRRELGPPDWRQLTSSQEIVVKDQLLSPLSIDPTTIFSVRAPELQFVMHQRKFFRWFSRHVDCPKTKIMDEKLLYCRQQISSSADLTKSAWIDGTNELIRSFIRIHIFI